MKNYYPEKPAVAYKPTPTTMSVLIDFIAALKLPNEVRRSVYIFTRNESANGKSCFNGNAGGIQADSGRWPAEYDKIITGVVTKVDSGHHLRYFCAFATYQDCLSLMAGRLQARGIFVGGYAHKYAKLQINNPTDLATAYRREWVTGTSTAVPTSTELKNFLSMYKQAAALF